MDWQWSSHGRRFAQASGILELMNDLGEAMSSGDENLCMLGGGNPSPVPEMQACFRREWTALAERPDELDAVL
ncbi:MAG: valine--pyruvate transaminase, partial [Kiritimatiellia bacterium]